MIFFICVINLFAADLLLLSAHVFDFSAGSCWFVEEEEGQTEEACVSWFSIPFLTQEQTHTQVT